MARRARYDTEGAPPRARRRSGGNEGILIALAIAGVLGVIMAFVISGGSSGEEEKVEAKAALRTLFETFLENDEKAGWRLIDPRQIMGELWQEKLKQWYDMSKEEQDEFAKKSWRLLRSQTFLEMGLKDKDMAFVDRVLSGATVDFEPARGEVEFTWTHLGNPWQARLQKNDRDKWVVFAFRQIR